MDQGTPQEDVKATETSEPIPNVETETNVQPVEEQTEPEWEDILGSGSILKKILRKGDPNCIPQRSQICTIALKCSLPDESIVERHESYELQLGDCEVVQGLDLAIGLMSLGEVCQLKIEARLAYGSVGLKPAIPPNATVHYTVELLSVEDDPDPETLEITERRKRGNFKKEKGNWWYTRGENHQAIQCYRRALDFLDEVEGGISAATSMDNTEATDLALQQLLEDRISVYNNMAAAQLKLELYDAALQSLKTVLRCQPDNIKALYRKAKVLRSKNDMQTALKLLQRAKKIAPDNGDVQKELNSIMAVLQKQKNVEKELARRMFNGSKSLVNENLKKSGKSRKMLIWSAIGASLAAGVAGLVAYRFKTI